jgi:glucan endo-1,3-alpha-glucosidase
VVKCREIAKKTTNSPRLFISHFYFSFLFLIGSALIPDLCFTLSILGFLGENLYTYTKKICRHDGMSPVHVHGDPKNSRRTKLLTETKIVPVNHTYTMKRLSQALLSAAACAFLLPGGLSAQALDPAFQSADTASQSSAPVDFLYVSPQGSDSFSGLAATAAGGNGPFQTLDHAQEAVSVLTASGLARPLEIVLDPAVCPAQDFLPRWFSSTPNSLVIWHSDPSRTVLIYTRTLSEQIDALSAEDRTSAPGARLVRFYVSPNGSDTWNGLLPVEESDVSDKTGPFLTLSHAQEAVNAARAANPSATVEVVLEESHANSGIDASASLPAAAKNSVKKPSKYTPAGLAALKTLTASKTLKAAIVKTVFTKGTVTSLNLAIGSSLNPKLVFAHYMVCNQDYAGYFGPGYGRPGSQVAGYEKEILQAQAAGIDGFVLNEGSWNSGDYKNDTEFIFEAAEALNTGFKLFFSADMTGCSFQEVQQMMTADANRPNYWHIQQLVGTQIVSRPVLSTWGGEGGGYTAAKGWWQNLVLNPLKAAGMNVYFMPGFFTTSPDGSQYLASTPSTIPTEINGLLARLSDGVFYCPSVGVPIDPARTMLNNAEGNAALYKAAGFGTMSSVSPQYWGSKQTSVGRHYMEYNGGEGLAAQWNSIINVQKPDWVEMFTWNDFDEATYFSPIDDVNKYWPYLAHAAPGFYKSHAGALALNQYYVNWFKSGTKPVPTSDSLYYFYRTHPKAAVATNDSWGRISWFSGDVEDTIFVTTILTAPATLVVTTGSHTLTYPVPAGLSNTPVPFQSGAQSFQLIRQGQSLLSQSGDPIIATPAEYDFNYSTGWASDQAALSASSQKSH